MPSPTPAGPGRPSPSASSEPRRPYPYAVARRRFLWLAAALLAVSTAAPAVAAQPEIRWTDPAGDATGFMGHSSTPRPSDPELDILEARYSFTGQSLAAWVSVDRMSWPAWSSAAVFRFHFRSGKHQYYLQSAFAGSGPYLTLFLEGGRPTLYRLSEAGREPIDCLCSATFDFKRSTASFTVRKNSLASALNVVVGQLKLEDLAVETLGHQPTVYSSSDLARALPGSVLRP